MTKVNLIIKLTITSRTKPYVNIYQLTDKTDRSFSNASQQLNLDWPF